jgi:hypothetical protein
MAAVYSTLVSCELGKNAALHKNTTKVSFAPADDLGYSPSGWVLLSPAPTPV